MRGSIIILAAVLVQAALAQGAEILTLDQAIALALEHNRNLQSSALDVKKAEERLAANKTHQLPAFSLYMLGAQQLRSFDFTLDKGVLGNYGSTGPLPDHDVHLKTPLAPTGFVTARVTQPLTSLIRVRRNLETLKTSVKLAQEQDRSNRQQTAREVKQIYYSLQQVESSLRSVRETANLYDEVEKLTSAYVLQEVALKGDLLEAQTRVAKTKQAETQLRNQEAAAKEQLNQLLGRDVLTEFEVQPALEAASTELTLLEARGRALNNRPEILLAELSQLQAEQDLRAKKAESIPDVSLEFNNVSFLNWGRFMPTQSTSAGVSLSWEPFDWGRKKHEAAEKQHTVNQARIAARDAESKVLVDVNDKFRQLEYKRAELRVAQLEQETSIENLRVVKNKYAARSALVRDVLQMQLNLEQSNAGYQQALTSFWNARADFERALGEDQ